MNDITKRIVSDLIKTTDTHSERLNKLENMGGISKGDLHEFKEEIKQLINQKFESHEAQERLMFAPIIDKVKEHEDILRGKDKSTGMIRDVNIFKWIAGGGLLSGLSNWFKDLIGKI